MNEQVTIVRLTPAGHLVVEAEGLETREYALGSPSCRAVALSNGVLLQVSTQSLGEGPGAIVPIVVPASVEVSVDCATPRAQIRALDRVSWAVVGEVVGHRVAIGKPEEEVTSAKDWHMSMEDWLKSKNYRPWL